MAERAMTRVEKQAEMHKEMREMKGQMVKTVSRVGRGGRLKGWFCCWLPLLVFFGGLVWVLWMIASTGLVRIPGITSLSYTAPEPERVVVPLGDLGQSIASQAQEQVNAQLAKGGDVQGLDLKIRLSEAVLTATMQDLLRKTGITSIESGRAQATVRDDGVLQLFLPLKDSALKTALRMDLVLMPSNGKLSAHVEHARIGTFPLPAFFAARFIDPSLQQSLASFNETLQGIGEVRTIAGDSGALLVSGVITATLETLMHAL